LRTIKKLSEKKLIGSKIFLVFSALFLVLAMRSAALAASAPYDPLHTMGALNMAIVSVHRITSAGDRIVLDQEYRNIINNLSLGNIEDDPELRELYRDLMEVIGNKALRGEETARFTERYNSLEKNRFVNLLSGARVSGNPWGFLGGILLNQATAYFGSSAPSSGLRDELDEELWKLGKSDVEESGKLQKRLLDSSWSLLRRYGLPDEYRLAQGDIDDFGRAVREPDGEKALRMFRALEPNFRAYPPFWYHYGAAALEAGDAAVSRRCFDEFERVWRPVLRQDPYRAEVAKHRARDLSERGEPKGKILEQLKIIVDNSPRENWINNLFAGVMYYSLGESARGVECVSVNVDFDVEREISAAALKNMKDGTLDVELFSDDVQSTLIAQRRGESSSAVERGLISWFKGDIEAASRLMLGRTGETDARDPVPYHVLLNMAEIPGARPSGAPALPDREWLKGELDSLTPDSLFSSYGTLLPIVERYASAGSPRAEIFLGDMYMRGLGVARDVERALELFSGPADGGDAYAQASLGEIFETWDGARDDAKAAGRYRQAAERGLAWAQTRLGDMYRDGRGVGQKNLEDAYMWYCLAQLNGDAAAKSRIDELDGRGILRGKSVSGATAKRARERAQRMYDAAGSFD
jgi:hypothetical protein